MELLITGMLPTELLLVRIAKLGFNVFSSCSVSSRSYRCFIVMLLFFYFLSSRPPFAVISIGLIHKFHQFYCDNFFGSIGVIVFFVKINFIKGPELKKGSNLVLCLR
jgi:hypothetical protein